jgi:uncharacterized damage-inducible protein DinB
VSRREDLLDFHARTHESFAGVIAHCGTLDPEELNRELPEYGDPTVRIQIHHVLGAERYWLGVLEGRIDVEEDQDSYPTIDALESFRETVAAATASHLRSTTDEAVSTPRLMMTWGNKERLLTPAHVILRAVTHNYHHQGKIVAMCRRLGKPYSGAGYPLG